jgi:CheY-like chemotaxis protein
MSDRPRCRILVVEDEAVIAMLVEDMVLEFGSEMVGPAAKMEEALRLASHAALDGAILDVNVGGAVVFPVADVLRSRGVPIIFATGYGSDGLPSGLRLLWRSAQFEVVANGLERLVHELASLVA